MGHIPSGIGVDEEPRSRVSFFATSYVFKRLPSTLRVILVIVVALCSFNVLSCTLVHLILPNIPGVKFYCVHFILMGGGLESHRRPRSS